MDQIAELYKQGLSFERVAAELQLPVHRVKRHLQSLGITRSRIEAVAMANKQQEQRLSYLDIAERKEAAPYARFLHQMDQLRRKAA
ncbi:hypothetical protein C8J23_101200 [Shewanella chilikensis]|uniref:Uncharacterized protein n=1 Tax=Shewanella chilikensis TaxID=558541 RepID=A0ABX5PTE8_9GAMM|nr:hypothetical protein [Shewanella chilikensis]MCL1154779.1 hypothetical protein [Shewanella chilikensis]PYE61158.1 hypothetical protein C8J23_101200 [Shewanella chilikensis]GGZ31775.1 hypothetical protein GCM10007105_19220 [Shewanella chilikensis]